MSHKLKLIASLAYTTILTLYCWYINAQSFNGIDDAHIYMVYMKHLAQGHGFVYNLGGEHVEGFTSLLWTLIGGLIFSITNHPEIFLLILNVLIVSYTLYKLICFIDNYFDKKTIAIQSILLLICLALMPGYFEWTVLSLLETGLWSSLLILTTLNVLAYNNTDAKNQSISFSILMLLLTICRPESLLWVPFFIAVRFVRFYLDLKNIKSALYQMWLPFATFLTTIGLLTLWRIKYFGYPLPNTFYAKVSANKLHNLKMGFKYITHYFFDNPLSLVLVSLSILFLVIGWKHKYVKSNFSKLVLIGMLYITLFIPLYSGGDHFFYYRFIQPSVPIFLLAFILVLDDFKISINPVFVLIISIFLIPKRADELLNLNRPMEYDFRLPIKDRKTSEKLNDFFSNLKTYPTQGVYAAGGSAYSYKGFTNDLMGLNNTEMAHADKLKAIGFKNHSAFNKQVFYKQKPDLFWLGGGFASNNQSDSVVVSDFSNMVYKGIQHDTEFRDQYVNCKIMKKGDSNALTIFASKDFIKNLDTTFYKVIVY